MRSLALKAWIFLVVTDAVMGLLLFGAAGTLAYWQPWLYLAVVFSASALCTWYLIANDPALLRRRLSGGPFAEQEKAQRVIMLLASIGLVALLVVPGLDRRFGWSQLPTALAVAGNVVIAGSLYVVYLVYRENSFAAATVQIAEDQRVISTGPYARLRHPMYAAAMLYCLATPPALGSYWGLLTFPAVAPALVWRLLHEEHFLAQRLPGYADYMNRVRWRLIPGLF